MKPLTKHLITVLFLSICIFLPLFLITLPIVGVFIIDDAVTGKELISTYLKLSAISIGIPALILFPLNVIFNHLAKSYKIFNWIIPIITTLTTDIVLFLFIISEHNDLVGILILSGFSIYISILFLFYRIIYKSIERIFTYSN